MDWPEGGMWVERNLQFSRWGLGGSGAQAAQMLAIVGAPALMSLEDRSRRQLSVIHPNVLVATNRGVIRCGELSTAQGRKPAHYIFEFTAGTQVGSIIPKRSSRTIVRFTDERLDNDSDFTRESITAAANAGAGILSGFNEIGDQDIEAALRETIALAQAWRNRGLKTIHLELGDFATVKARDTVLEKLGGAFTSLGMSYSELCALCVGSQDTISKAFELGIDVCKLLWFYRPDSEVAEHQREVVRSLVRECAELSLPLVVEPIWFPLEGEDPKSDAWKLRRGPEGPWHYISLDAITGARVKSAVLPLR
jgi:ADP-specific Phosphofructokinase/Glucokinase conserved region